MTVCLNPSGVCSVEEKFDWHDTNTECAVCFSHRGVEGTVTLYPDGWEGTAYEWVTDERMLVISVARGVTQTEAQRAVERFYDPRYHPVIEEDSDTL